MEVLLVHVMEKLEPVCVIDVPPEGNMAILGVRRHPALERFKDVLVQADFGPSLLALYDDPREAAIASAMQDPSERAVRCLEAPEALGERLGLDFSIPSERAAWNLAITAAQRAIGQPAFASAWAKGRLLQPAEATALLLTIPLSSAPEEAQVVLSERELEVLRLLVTGQTDRAIGEALYISHRTVEFHVSRILAKLGASKRSGAVAAALAAGLVEPTPSSRL